MIKRITYLAIVFALIPSFTSVLLSQGVSFDNTGGTFINNGTFRVKAGQVKSLPDTIGGRVEFLAFNPAWTQDIPNIVFHQLVLSGKGFKIIDSLRNSKGFIYPLAILDSLVMVDSAYVQVVKERIFAYGSVENQVYIGANKEIRLLNENYQQDIWGRGNFPYLNIDNPKGVNVIKSGGFKVEKQLELTRGQLRNDKSNNFSMADSSMIIRHSEGSLAEEPSFGKNVDLKYVGGSEILSGKEVPSDTTVLKDLIVENTGGLKLSKDITVKNQITVATQINTEENDTVRHILNLTSALDPIYTTPEAEIIGSLRRTYMKYDSTVMLFNNRYTFSIFANQQSANGAKELTFRVKPRTFPPFLNGTSKVKRFITISAKDSVYNPVQFGLQLRIGYGWRNSPNDTIKDETNGLVIDQLKLQRWSGSDWLDQTHETVPVIDAVNDWVYNYAVNVSSLGDFAIGMPGDITHLVLMGKVILEGAYRFGSMQNDLRTKNLIPATPPDIYPYNLDPKRASYNQTAIPDSAVDWILLEFRNKVSSLGVRYISCFVGIDGKIIGRDGSYPLNLYSEGIDSGEYFLAVRHRNHLSVVTENSINLYPEKSPKDTLDFSKPENLLGRENSLRILGFKSDGSLLFGLIAGDINGDGIIDDSDLIGSWEDRDYEDLYKATDINMSGFFNTRDFNFVWNNRGRRSAVK